MAAWGSAGCGRCSDGSRRLRAGRCRRHGQLERGLEAATSRLKAGGRLAVISFHSLEDRAVKQFIRGEPAPRVRRGLPQPAAALSPLVAVGKAVFASESEVEANPRARSAVLRVAERRADGASA